MIRKSGATEVKAAAQTRFPALGPEWRGPGVSAVSALLAVTGILGCELSSKTAGRDVDALPVMGFTEELRIGSRDDPDFGFSEIGPATVDRDGQIWVLEFQDQTIRVYSPTGDLIRVLGGRGEGPGEFQMVGRTWGVVGDTVWAIDVLLSRITLFDRQGTVLSTGRYERIPVPLQGGRQTGQVRPRALRSDGLFSSSMSGFTSQRDAEESAVGAQDTVRVPRVLYDPSGVVVDTMGWDLFPPRTSETQWLEAGGVRYPVPLPPSADPLQIDLAETRWIIERPVAQSEEPPVFRITRYGGPGDTIFAETCSYHPQPYPAEVLDSVAWENAQSPFGARIGAPEGADVHAVLGALRGAMEFPDFQPPVQGGIGGDDGTLWLEREDMGGETHRWLVIDADGTPRGHLHLPRNWTVSWVNADGFLAIEPDEFDVPWLLKFRIDPVEADYR